MVDWLLHEGLNHVVSENAFAIIRHFLNVLNFMVWHSNLMMLHGSMRLPMILCLLVLLFIDLLYLLYLLYNIIINVVGLHLGMVHLVGCGVL